jgi:hypothetical protein
MLPHAFERCLFPMSFPHSGTHCSRTLFFDERIPLGMMVISYNKVSDTLCSTENRKLQLIAARLVGSYSGAYVGISRDDLANITACSKVKSRPKSNANADGENHHSSRSCSAREVIHHDAIRHYGIAQILRGRQGGISIDV